MSTPIYETIVEQSNDGILVAVDGEIVYTNPQLQQMTGYSEAELAGAPKIQIFASEDQDLVQTYHNKRRDGETAPATYEAHLETNQGNKIPVEISVSDGEYNGTVASYAICRDITELKEQQTELETSQKRLRALFDKAPESVAVHTETGEMLDVNDQAAKISGYSREDLIGMNVSAFEASRSDAEMRTLWQSMEFNETVTIDATHEHKDGSQYPVEVRVTKLEVDGKPRYLALARDLSERRERQREIETLKERLELAVEGAGVGVWDWDMQTDAVEFNEQWAEMLGYSLNEIEPHLDSWKDRTHPEDIETVLTALESHIQAETDYYDTDHRMQTADGDWRWIRDLGKIVDRDDDGEPLRAVGLHIDVDEQRQQKKELTQLKTRFETFAQTINEALFLLPVDYSETLYVNGAVERIYGVTPQEAYEDPTVWLQHIHPEDREALRAAMDDFQEGRITGTVSQRYRIQHPDRGLRWMETEISVITDESGTTTQIAGITRDVTEQKQREMELTQFQEAVDQTADAVCIVDANGEVEYTNATFEDLKDTIDAAKFQKLPQMIRSENSDDTTVTKFWETVRAGDKWVCEITSQQPTGDSITVSQVVSPISDSSGEPQMFVTIARDITEQKQYERKLKNAQENLRDVIDLVPDIIALKDKDGRYILANQATAETYGTTIEELEGTFEKSVNPSAEDAERFRQENAKIIESGEPMQIPEEELTTADGETKILQTTKIPYKTNGGGTDAVLLYARDITALKQYEQQLQKQRDNLDLLNQVVRHDIRNDLQLIQAYGEMLTEVDSLSEQQRQFIAKVLKAANNAVDLTTSARDLSEVMLQDETELKPMSLAQTVEQQVDRLRSAAQSAIITIDGSLPDADVVADELLEAVFRNLLKNAVQHNDKDLAEISVSATVDGDQAVVRVADNGPGVSELYKNEIFGRGNQGLESEGTGIGLHLVKTLVDRYGGSVWVEDNDPEGAIFSVQLQVDS